MCQSPSFSWYATAACLELERGSDPSRHWLAAEERGNKCPRRWPLPPFGAPLPCAPVFRTMDVSRPAQCARDAQHPLCRSPVAVSSGLPLFPSRRVCSPQHPIHHPDPHTGAPWAHHVSWRPRGIHKQSEAPLYLRESGLRLLVDTMGPSTYVMGLRGGRMRIEWWSGELGRSPMPAGRERAAFAFGSRSVEGGSQPALCTPPSGGWSWSACPCVLYRFSPLSRLHTKSPPSSRCIIMQRELGGLFLR